MKNFFLCLMLCACASTSSLQPIIENKMPPPETSTLERNVDATVVVYIEYWDKALNRSITDAAAGVVINERYVLLRIPQDIRENEDLIKIRETRIGPPGVSFLQAPWSAEIAVIGNFTILVRAKENLPRPCVVLAEESMPKVNEILYAVSVRTTSNDEKVGIGTAAYATRAMVVGVIGYSTWWNFGIAFKSTAKSGPVDMTTGSAGIFNKKHEMVGFGAVKRENFHLTSEAQRIFFDDQWSIIGNYVPWSGSAIIPYLQQLGISYTTAY